MKMWTFLDADRDDDDETTNKQISGLFQIQNMERRKHRTLLKMKNETVPVVNKERMGVLKGTLVGGQC